MDLLEIHKSMYRITKHQLDLLSQEAVESLRKRAFLKLHNHADPVLKLLNALEPETYIQPHKHFLKNHQELFVALRGELVVILFDDQGNVIEYILIGPQIETIIFEVPQDTWHTIWPLEKGSIVMEVIKGPYIRKSFKKFAAWAPSESDPGHLWYKKKLLKLLKLSI